MMSLRQRLLVAIALLSLVVLSVESLRCFQCGTTAAFHDCIHDWSGLVNTSRGLTDKYSKNCTDANVNWTRCMIQTSEGNGKQVLFHRGCHDGEHFSTLYEDQRFINLPPNNETTCATIVGSREFVCFRFCDTDFCNGPQIPDHLKPVNCSIAVDDVRCGAVSVQQTITFVAVLTVCTGAILQMV